MPALPSARSLAFRRLLPNALLALLLVGGTAGAQNRLPAEINAALARAKVPAEALAVLVVDVDGRAPARLSHRAGVPMNPASVMKLVTTYAALDTLGPTYAWATPVYVEGTARNGTLYGNVYIKGQGDPKLVMERLWLLLRRVQGLDIKTIAGDIVLDRSAFELPAPDPGEFDGERLRPYNAAPDALLLNYKSVVMTFVPDRSANAAHVSFDPPLASVQLQTHVPLIEADCGDYRAALRADLSDPARIRFAGRYPASCGEKVWPLAYADPASYAVRAVEGLWREMGGQLQGRVREGTLPAGLAPAFELASPPLAEVIRDINKYSNNVMAQQLFLTMSLAQKGTGSYAASRELVQDWWRERFGDNDLPVLDNGSGLSRSARISAHALAKLLLHAWHSPLLPELASSLPITGVDGTLRRVRNRAQGSAHLKTGSLRDVVAVAGFVDGRSGRRYVLVAMANHANASAARPAIEALIEWTVNDL
ncbi:MAG: D-alanyl-D-alanine carboxypeptidase/D-alanyl-D-alanine-endopeptidase [Curvibacter sp. GWA2_64_110]|nr:MAG: D-alanyl-D-alanine carboxypeptidase/D-alanyl-D-alanine-endopeptidase [Curvibacter sp. GWA2_64_110]HCY16117.1 D-alanyl-D-alanine carboxypeptidase/D-alanyl-D-alanine-endopeptidase [Curvibacter sp.]